MATELTDRLKAEAFRLGFDQVGIAPAVSPPGYPRFRAWLEAGNDAGMTYMSRGADAREHPSHLLDGVRSVVVVSFVYGRREAIAAGAGQGKVARYARGEDYHEILWRRLERLLEWLRNEVPDAHGRAVADTAPLLERDFARLAGLGWIGKNTMLIDRKLGSFSVLGALLVDVELAYDAPHVASHCGTCTRCLDACPTDAFTAPYELDSRRCLSYWTIEQRGIIPDEIAERMDGWVFGCDVCQDVCPWNRKAPAGREPGLQADEAWTYPALVEWLEQAPETFTKSLKGKALKRAKRSGLLRNAALILGARRDSSALDALIARLDDGDSIVRASAAWALGKIASDTAIAALEAHQNEPDPLAREAIQRALSIRGQ
jgi:epoxyqueuosine reductase